MRLSLSLMLLSSLISYVSCGTYRPPEALSDKMQRFKPTKVNPNPIPQMALWKPRLGTVKKLRQTPPTQEAQAYKKLSNKKLYFSALYHQYNELRTYLPTEEKTPSVDHCPKHHNIFLKLKETIVKQPKRLNVKKRYLSVTQSSNYPELTLPVGGQTLKDHLVGTASLKEKEQVIQTALKAHTSRVYAELKEVCDSGSSENYFNFENVITHAQRHRHDFQQDTQKSMKSLLRTTLYYNKALLKGLSRAQDKGRFPASTNKSEDASFSAVAEKLDSTWSLDYFDAL